ncbi:hypothetical protein GUJ93_ZPchr0002g24909 [Zizania palustris]|uniref:F-box protein AT5G49610-like beta-propeller domain-containing protein n=1 Tax=Zizania palustris TaxID=103762 RepID=A0A8J5RFR0_ZIZPA|nr:hypothetical protein GUJ93_ZPchr0002g24909 [Zizania palustris]KAG8058564.1 hypothetical protein GUJ93_ZPchr0002g24909 [Zizania palustris]KAG8058565.1 hypothetical protein GUJ93_ZPchr0002g24909 [Zizania palustris]KAG8058566.1 hypothetical protein GUJ93_ZPchr0002g24909 [Zizania palustris]KAG8058567.1 hypothetical protein GUJ93_ZPchr0002g24909 [Zizania palustris]
MARAAAAAAAAAALQLPPVAPRAGSNPSTTTIASLSDDIVLEIFLRLPSLPSLVRATMTCRPWLRAVVSSPEFRRRFRALHPNPILGYFLDSDGSDFPVTPIFVKSSPPEADFTDGFRFGDFFLHSLMQEGDPPGWHVCDCRGGYLLLLNSPCRKLAALNPLIWDVAFFPLPPGDIELEFVGFHLLSSDEDPWSFRVVCVCRDEFRVRAAVFSSKTWDWIIHPWVEFDRDSMPMLKASVLVNGSIYWPHEGGGGMMTLNAATLVFSSVGLPCEFMIQGCSFSAGETKDGGLCLVYAIDIFLTVWIPRVDNDGIERWMPLMVVTLAPYMRSIIGDWQANYSGLRVVGVRSGYVFLQTVTIPDSQAPCWFFSVSLETMRLENLFPVKPSSYFYPHEVEGSVTILGEEWMPMC